MDKDRVVEEREREKGVGGRMGTLPLLTLVNLETVHSYKTGYPTADVLPPFPFPLSPLLPTHPPLLPYIFPLSPIFPLPLVLYFILLFSPFPFHCSLPVSCILFSLLFFPISSLISPFPFHFSSCVLYFILPPFLPHLFSPFPLIHLFLFLCSFIFYSSPLCSIIYFLFSLLSPLFFPYIILTHCKMIHCCCCSPFQVRVHICPFYR